MYVIKSTAEETWGMFWSHKEERLALLDQATVFGNDEEAVRVATQVLPHSWSIVPLPDVPGVPDNMTTMEYIEHLEAKEAELDQIKNRVYHVEISPQAIREIVDHLSYPCKKIEAIKSLRRAIASSAPGHYNLEDAKEMIDFIQLDLAYWERQIQPPASPITVPIACPKHMGAYLQNAASQIRDLEYNERRLAERESKLRSEIARLEAVVRSHEIDSGLQNFTNETVDLRMQSIDGTNVTVTGVLEYDGVDDMYIVSGRQIEAEFRYYQIKEIAMAASGPLVVVDLDAKPPQGE